MNKKIVKIALALLLLGCLAPLPYGYYQFIRFVAMIGFAYFGYDSLSKKEEALPWVYFGLALLFQPIVKIALGREVWNIVDVVVAGFLIWSIFSRKNQE
jgi:hypothetical protein